MDGNDNPLGLSRLGENVLAATGAVQSPTAPLDEDRELPAGNLFHKPDLEFRVAGVNKGRWLADWKIASQSKFQHLISRAGFYGGLASFQPADDSFL